jgi:hypothetical protein
VKNQDRSCTTHPLATVNPPFNSGTIGRRKSVEPMKAAEYFREVRRIRDDTRTSPSLEHPYFAVTGPDGTFSIDCRPAGRRLTVTFWHESTPRHPG